MNDERLITLEIKSAHQEETIQKLDKAIQEQQKRIETLETTNKYLISKFNALRESVDIDSDNEPPPPHYWQKKPGTHNRVTGQWGWGRINNLRNHFARLTLYTKLRVNQMLPLLNGPVILFTTKLKRLIVM